MTYVIPANIVGNRYSDSFGRSLKVIEVQPGDPLGREVIGRIKNHGIHDEAEDYATDLKTFEAYFIRKIVPSERNRKTW